MIELIELNFNSSLIIWSKFLEETKSLTRERKIEGFKNLDTVSRIKEITIKGITVWAMFSPFNDK